MRDLAGCCFIAHRRNVVLAGGTGSGKTHLAIAVARSCIRNGARGRFYNVVDLVRVPVFISHSEAVNIEFEQPITADEARQTLHSAPGCPVIDKRKPGGYLTPYEAAGEDATYISRIREDATVENGLSMWVVSDNLRKGAALNAVQIAEALINRKLIEAKQKTA